MSYAHCQIGAAIDPEAADSVMDDLLDVVTRHPATTEGVYVISIGPSEATAKLSARAAVSAGLAVLSEASK